MCVCVIVRSANQMQCDLKLLYNHGELFGQLFPHIRPEPACHTIIGGLDS